ncbi:MAG: C39 family peptidase [Patescibacteria group bacterium]
MAVRSPAEKSAWIATKSFGQVKTKDSSALVNDALQLFYERHVPAAATTPMGKTRNIILQTLLIVFILAGLGYLSRHRLVTLWERWMEEPEPPAISVTNFLNQPPTNLNTNGATNVNSPANVNVNAAPAVLPAEFNLDVPFTTQSPYARWTEQDEESCEEAAALIVHYYWQNKTFTQPVATQELQTIVDYEMRTFGFYKDTTAEQTAEFIRGLWGYKKVVVTYDFILDDIKKEVAQGRPVILPTAGRMLGNPNFKSPGPLYHMLVVRGWTKRMITTNDPGPRKGEGYQYSPDVLLNAIHDWNGGDVDTGRKVMIVVWPNE